MEKIPEERDESDELEAKVQEQGEHDDTPNEKLAGEVEDELLKPEEKSEADELVEQEEQLTIPEQKWLEDLEHRVKEWKESPSKQPYSAKDAIRKLKIEDFTEKDIELFRLFRCTQKSPSSLYFKQKFGQVLRKQEHDTKGGMETTSYQFTKVLRALSSAEQE